MSENAYHPDFPLLDHLNWFKGNIWVLFWCENSGATVQSQTQIVFADDVKVQRWENGNMHYKMTVQMLCCVKSVKSCWRTCMFY